MNNVYKSLDTQALPAGGAFVYSAAIDSTYMTVLTTFVTFTQTGGPPAGNMVMVIESSPDNGTTWFRQTATQFDAVSGSAVKLHIGDALYEFPAASGTWATPFSMAGHFLVRFGFAMQSGNDPIGDVKFEYGVALRTPP